MTRLHSQLLEQLPNDILKPHYDRNQATGVVHLGIGAFHRAHQAVYFDALLNQGDAGWMICGASLRSEHVAQALNPQNGLFTVRSRDDTQDKVQIIGSVKEVLVGRADPAALVARLASPETKLVTLTVTEKGYYMNIAAQTLLESSPGIAHDIAHIGAPVTPLGFLVAGLAARKAAGLTPFTVLSCDNLPHNGHIARIGVVSLAERISPELARWIETEVAFPSSMLDRIVRAVAASDIDELEAKTGWRDEGMVKTEPFSQWVIEDAFCNDRPKLEDVGVQFTSDVRQWEAIKLRMLNGAHSALAYRGGLAGHEYVSDAVAIPEFEMFIHQLWDEVEETLPLISGFSVKIYRNELFNRFRNSTLQHRIQQIATDGSQKIPQRLLAPLRERSRRGLQSPALITAVACWIKWQRGVDNDGTHFEIIDPLSEQLSEIVAAANGDASRLVHAITSLESVFGKNFNDDAARFQALCEALNQLD